MKKNIYVVQKGTIGRLFCRHIWSEPQGGGKIFLLDFDMAPHYQICLKCGQERKVVTVQITQDPKDAIIEEAERLLKEG